MPNATAWAVKDSVRIVPNRFCVRTWLLNCPISASHLSLKCGQINYFLAAGMGSHCVVLTHRRVADLLSFIPFILCPCAGKAACPPSAQRHGPLCSLSYATTERSSWTATCSWRRVCKPRSDTFSSSQTFWLLPSPSEYGPSGTAPAEQTFSSVEHSMDFQNAFLVANLP